MLLGINLLLWTTHVSEKDLPLLERLKKTGFDGVEIPVFHGEPEKYQKIGQWLRELGLRVTALGFMPGVEFSCIADDEATRKRALEHLKWTIDCAGAAGGEVLCGPLHQPMGVFSGAPVTNNELASLISVSREAAQYAATKNIKLAVEPLNRFECYVLNTVDAAAEVVRAVGMENYGLLYDTFHQNIEEKSPVGCIAPAINQINHVHLSENDRGTPGKGHIPWQETLREFKTQGYEGWYVIEAFDKPMPEIAAATRVWRPLSPAQEIYQYGHDFLRQTYYEA
ncbi:sugar phosphate isomerase/epimerase [Klebsiella indica]|uniref:Sugar phosphate isomerase/epimerase n=1 Tax=Klebsiella indica TaxID=2582917 RepID=A0A5R9L8P0_9ENTR|nr:sugar phosphate isomerase/epimerase family protein [Klebsiella indica]TLV04885.1 sugar phosphate isomerase/epimerase [Klebsiella indica]